MNLKDTLNQILNKGEVIALVGNANSGKSTIITELAADTNVKRLLARRENSNHKETEIYVTNKITGLVAYCEINEKRLDELLIDANYVARMLYPLIEDKKFINKILLHDDKLMDKLISTATKILGKCEHNPKPDFTASDKLMYQIMITLYRNLDDITIKAYRSLKSKRDKIIYLENMLKCDYYDLDIIFNLIIDLVNHERQIILDEINNAEDIIRYNDGFVIELTGNDNLSKYLLDGDYDYLFDKIAFIFEGIQSVLYSRSTVVDNKNTKVLRLLDMCDMNRQCLNQYNCNKALLTINVNQADMTGNIKEFLTAKNAAYLQIYPIFTFIDIYLNNKVHHNERVGKFNYDPKPDKDILYNRCRDIIKDLHKNVLGPSNKRKYFKTTFVKDTISLTDYNTYSEDIPKAIEYILSNSDKPKYTIIKKKDNEDGVLNKKEIDFEDVRNSLCLAICNIHTILDNAVIKDDIENVLKYGITNLDSDYISTMYEVIKKVVSGSDICKLFKAYGYEISSVDDYTDKNVVLRIGEITFKNMFLDAFYNTTSIIDVKEKYIAILSYIFKEYFPKPQMKVSKNKLRYALDLAIAEYCEIICNERYILV